MSGNWITAAIFSAATLGLVNIIDSHLISKRMPSFRAFLLLVSAILLVYGLVLYFLFPMPAGISARLLLVAIASGVLRTAAVTILLYALKREEVSRVVPVVYTYPLFVAIMAVPFLGETLYYLKWIAIIMIVAGAVIISPRQSSIGSRVRLGRSFFLLFGSGLLMAMADVTTKYVLAYISSWNMYWVTFLCISGIYLLVSLRPHIIRELGNMKQWRSTTLLLAFNETLAMIGVVLSFWAMERGPVSMVSAIVGSRPIFVVTYALILSRASPMFLEWQPGKAMLALRLIAVTLIVSGIAIIYLA